MSHTMKIWERIIEARLTDRVEISKQQYGFMPGKETTDAMCALKMLMKRTEGQRELNCVFVDLEKGYDRVPGEELWYCMRKSTTESFKVKVGLHEGSQLNPFLFAVIMDRLTDEVKEKTTLDDAVC